MSHATFASLFQKPRLNFLATHKRAAKLTHVWGDDIFSFIIGVMSVFLSSTAVQAQVQTACDTAGKVAVAPIMSTHIPPPYPRSPQVVGQEGGVILKVTLGTDGIPEDVSVAVSSGFHELDSQAATYVKEHWQWKNPTFDCKPAELEVFVFIAFDMMTKQTRQIYNLMASSAERPSSAGSDEQGRAIFRVQVSADGKVLASKLKESSGFDDLDAAAVSVIGKHIYHVDHPSSENEIEVRVLFIGPDRVRRS